MIGRVLFVATTAAALQAPFARVKNVQPAPPAGFQWADSAGAVVPTKAAKPAKEAVPALPAPVAQVRPFDASAKYDGEGFLDEQAVTAQTWRGFTMSPATAVKKARWVLAEPRIGLKDGGACLSPDFEFQAPIIGPLDKDRFTGALDQFRLLDAFPDMTENWHFFRADPFEPGRVWYQTRSRATHSGVETKFCGKPTGKELVFPPQAFSIRFDNAGLVRELTVGYVIDKRQGNTGGLGGAFGYFYGVGKPLPFPEAKPFKPSLRLRLLNWVGKLAARFNK